MTAPAGLSARLQKLGMFGIGTWEMVVILALALIVLGPKKLPEMARSLGRGLANLRRTADEVKREIDLEGMRREFEEIEEDAGIEELKRMVDVRSEIRRAVADLDKPLEATEPDAQSQAPSGSTPETPDDP